MKLMWPKKRQTHEGFVMLMLVALVAAAVIAAAWLVAAQRLKNDPPPELPPTAPQAKTVSIAAVGDIACSPNYELFNGGEGAQGACQHKKVAAAIKQARADALLLLGDIQYSYGDYEEYVKSFVPAFRDVGSPIIAAAGNHEYQRGNAAGYFKAFATFFPSAKYLVDGKTYFATTLGQWRVIVLDSDCEYVGGCDGASPQYKWLSKELSSSSAKCTLAMWHHPVITSGEHKENASTGRAKEMFRLLIDKRADVVLSGHDHNYERFGRHLADGRPDPAGIRSFVVGTGGQSLYGFKQPLLPAHQAGLDNVYGYLKMLLKPDAYDWQFVDVSGTVRDRGSDSCV